MECLTSDAETSTKQAATQAQEIEVTSRVQEDLRAREAYYYESCRRNLLVKVKRRVCKQHRRKIVILLIRKLLMS